MIMAIDDYEYWRNYRSSPGSPLDDLRPALVDAVQALIAAYANQDAGVRGYIFNSARSKLHCRPREIELAIRDLTERTQYRIERDEELRARGKRKHFDPAEVFARDGRGCNLCGVTEAVRPVIDHVVPWAFGGLDGWINLQIACRKCNAAKSCDWAGSLDEHRLAEALAASPAYNGPVRNRERLLAVGTTRPYLLRGLP